MRVVCCVLPLSHVLCDGWSRVCLCVQACTQSLLGVAKELITRDPSARSSVDVSLATIENNTGACAVSCLSGLRVCMRAVTSAVGGARPCTRVCVCVCVCVVFVCCVLLWCVCVRVCAVAGRGDCVHVGDWPCACVPSARCVAGRTPLDVCIDSVVSPGSTGRRMLAHSGMPAFRGAAPRRALAAVAAVAAPVETPDAEATLLAVRAAASNRPRQLVSLDDVNALVARELAKAEPAAGAAGAAKKDVSVPALELRDLASLVKRSTPAGK